MQPDKEVHAPQAHHQRSADDKALIQPLTRIARMSALLALLGAALFLGSGAIRDSLVETLGNRFSTPQWQLEGRVDGIVVLGGGTERIYETVRLANRLSGVKVLVSGIHESELEYIRAHIDNPERVFADPHARNTYENAVSSTDWISAPDSHKWLLVTSALHMPRAIACFRKVGLNVVAWPVPERTFDRSMQLYIAAHEWMGLIGYRILSRTNDVFPEPVQEPSTGHDIGSIPTSHNTGKL